MDIGGQAWRRPARRQGRCTAERFRSTRAGLLASIQHLPTKARGKALLGWCYSLNHGARLTAFLRVSRQTVESLYVLYKTTGNPVWRDRAWEIFEAIRKHCRVADGGYSSVIGLDRRDPSHSDAMPRSDWVSLDRVRDDGLIMIQCFVALICFHC